MIRKELDGVEWLEFELFSELPELVHGIFLRGNGGGTSDSSRAAMQKALGFDELVSAAQKHGTNIVKVPSTDALLNENCDGMMTEASGLGLLINHADCQAAVIYDPVKKAIGAVHCGWRGNVHNMYAHAVQFMRQAVGSRAEDLLVGISPSLGPQHSEFIHYEKEWPNQFWEFQIRPTYFDLWEMSRYQLEEAGVLPHHIEVANICTYENKEDFFSYRRDKIAGSNNGTVIAMRE
ncbi:MAG: Laccase domain protein YfiH [Chlamydiae bacterium]|nr:Laccase domain protein YfiH [Chlamydiota bacterium]